VDELYDDLDAHIHSSRGCRLARQARRRTFAEIKKPDVCAATSQNIVGDLIGWTHTFVDISISARIVKVDL